MRSTFTNCFFLLLISWSGYCQPAAKSLLSQSSLNLLTKEICACMEEKMKASADTKAAVESCFSNVFEQFGPTVLEENNLEDTREVGLQVGQEIVAALQKDCSVFIKARESSPNQQLLNKAESLRSAGNFNEALPLFDQLIALALRQIDKSVFNNRGLTRLETGDIYGAIADFKYALEKDSTTAVSYNNLGMAKTKLGDANGAYADYSKAIKIDSTQGIFFSNRGMLLYDADNFQEADNDLRRSLLLDSTLAVSCYYRGLIGQQRENYSDTTAGFFNKAIKLEPTNQIYRNDRGLFWWNKKAYKAAQADFQEVIKQQPTYNPAYYNLAMLCQEEKKTDEAIRYMKEAIRLAPEKDFYYHNLGQMLFTKGNYKEALTASSKAIEMNDEKAGFYDLRGEIYERLGKTSEALDDYTRSISLYDRDGSIYYRRGMLRLKKKDSAGACEDFKLGKLLKDKQSQQASAAHCGK
jgi:tetratricopeptide (TPR) repeat protein